MGREVDERKLKIESFPREFKRVNSWVFTRASEDLSKGE